MGIFSNLKKIALGTSLSDDTFDDLEEQLIMADVGVETSLEIVDKMRKEAKAQKMSDPKELYPILNEEIVNILSVGKEIKDQKPQVILVIGVNGVGKTTTIGKLANIYRKQGKSVILAAADTFRAAATEQLDIWAKRSDATIISHSEGADPAAVVHDALEAGLARKTDVIICDTAGRLQNKKNLMDELSKIRRVIEKNIPSVEPEILLVIDATTGQNGLSQAELFSDAAGVTGIVLTKLDGTAKGGIVLAIAKKTGLPVKFVGLGEGIDDLHIFDKKEFANDLVGM